MVRKFVFIKISGMLPSNQDEKTSTFVGPWIGRIRKNGAFNIDAKGINAKSVENEYVHICF